MSKEEEQKIIDIRKEQPYLGPVRIKYEHNIKRSPSSINRVLKEAGLTKSREKKYKVKRGKTPYEVIIESFKAETIQMPPGQCTYNSDIEAAHRLIEDEFYDMEDYKNKIHLLSKAFTYILYFNYFRKFRYKGLKSPIEIFKEINNKKINLNLIGNLKPIILDSLIKYIKFHAKYESYYEGKGGCHVTRSDK